MINIPVEPKITEYLHRKAAKLNIPLNGTFELTPLCNMDCKMCYVKMGKKEQQKIHPLRSAEEWLWLGKIAREKGMMYLLLTGGEPFLRADFKEIFQGLHRMGLIISINSNGTLIDEETVKWLKETPPMRINITLYGASDETYDVLCGNPRGFTQVTNAIRLLKEAGIVVKLNCSVTPHNVKDLEKIFDFAKKEKLIIQATSYMFPPVRRNKNLIGKNERFTPEEASYYAAKIEVLTNGQKRFIQKVQKQNYNEIWDGNTKNCMENEGEAMKCRAGKCSFWITWDGRMLPCGMLISENAPDVFLNGFEKSWKQICEEVRTIRLPGKCKKCVFKDKCRTCAAMVLTESGTYDQAPEYRCEMMENYSKTCRKIEAEILKDCEG